MYEKTCEENIQLVKTMSENANEYINKIQEKEKIYLIELSKMQEIFKE